MYNYFFFLEKLAETSTSKRHSVLGLSMKIFDVSIITLLLVKINLNQKDHSTIVTCITITVAFQCKSALQAATTKWRF